MVLVLALLAGCGGSRSATGHASSTTGAVTTTPVPFGFPSTFLAVATTAAVVRGDQLLRYAVNELQVRSSSGGALRRTLLQSLGLIDAAVARDGSIVVAIDYRCRSVIERIAPTSGEATVVRTVPDAVQDISLSPSSTELAYLTYPSNTPKACIPAVQPASPQPLRVSAGAAQFLPNILSVLDLATGTIRSTATDSPGHPFSRPSWSLDGSQISVGYMGATPEALAFTSSALDFATARHLVPPAGCGFSGQTWTASGIVVVEGCGPDGADLSPGALVRLDNDGTATMRWALPACIDGITPLVDSSSPTFSSRPTSATATGHPAGFPTRGPTPS